MAQKKDTWAVVPLKIEGEVKKVFVKVNYENLKLAIIGNMSKRRHIAIAVLCSRDNKKKVIWNRVNWEEVENCVENYILWTKIEAKSPEELSKVQFHWDPIEVPKPPEKERTLFDDAGIDLPPVKKDPKWSS